MNTQSAPSLFLVFAGVALLASSLLIGPLTALQAAALAAGLLSIPAGLLLALVRQISLELNQARLAAVAFSFWVAFLVPLLPPEGLLASRGAAAAIAMALAVAAGASVAGLVVTPNPAGESRATWLRGAAR